MNSTSPYLKQHAHNPVFWYPWGKDAIERARTENKPILLSIGYSTCYWCHVMERDVFENLSIASLMNRTFINIKVDREEHPELDEIYMVARQLMTHEGGWPNNVFLTPDLKPFYAGGTFAAEDAYGKPSFPRLIEWLHYSWTTQEAIVRSQAEDVTKVMQPYLLYTPPADAPPPDANQLAAQLFKSLTEFHDLSSGGFFQAPKFPHECYHNFLLTYYEYTGNVQALDITAHSLGKMAAGGLYDHVGCGFHRYAVDKEWYVPHFEKMLYNQALLARNYIETARLTGNGYFADIAKSILDFVSGPLTDGNGAFYSAIDAETNAVEGAYYAWKAEELEALLTPEEIGFFTQFYALADIPAFPGHKHADGQVIIARKPLAQAALENGIPYVQLAAMAAHVMNKLLPVRNQRQSPALDDKIIVSWNGLMIDAYAHAGSVFDNDRYTKTATRAANYILEHGIDNEGRLCRIIAGGKAQLPATLEDFAYLIKGLITLHKATGDAAMLDAAISLANRVEENFADKNAPGYFGTNENEHLLLRIKSNDDSTLPNPNAVMAQNLTELFVLTQEQHYKNKAKALVDYFLSGAERVMVESASMLESAMKLFMIEGKQTSHAATFTNQAPAAPDDVVAVSASLFPADAKPGENCEVIITLDIKDGWHINANRTLQPLIVPTQVDIQGQGVTLVDVIYPEALTHKVDDQTSLKVFRGLINVTARIRLDASDKPRPALKIMVRFQPCSGSLCHALHDSIITI